tara:strand:+ start:128 stop:262 length:135 start_codon:yes stop_codon:yes gene_type:complete
MINIKRFNNNLLFSFIDLKYKEVIYRKYESGIVYSKNFEDPRFH